MEAEASQLLAAWRGGDLGARDRLVTLFYPDLRRLAAAMLRRERGASSLSTRDLIHEGVARLIALNRIAWADRAHVLALASTMMRRFLIDHARAQRRLKREGELVTLKTAAFGEPALESVEIEALGEALGRLSRLSPEGAEIVEMRYFGGMELTEIAQVLGCSESTVKRRWTAARLWLLDALAEDA